MTNPQALPFPGLLQQLEGEPEPVQRWGRACIAAEGIMDALRSLAGEIGATDTDGRYAWRIDEIDRRRKQLEAALHLHAPAIRSAEGLLADLSPSHGYQMLDGPVCASPQVALLRAAEKTLQIASLPFYLPAIGLPLIGPEQVHGREAILASVSQIPSEDWQRFTSAVIRQYEQIAKRPEPSTGDNGSKPAVSCKWGDLTARDAEVALRVREAGATGISAANVAEGITTRGDVTAIAKDLRRNLRRLVGLGVIEHLKGQRRYCWRAAPQGMPET